LGNALLKSTLPVLLGQVFSKYGGRSDAAYSYYYLAITLGGLASSIAVGYLAQEFGWGAGFACAAMGMLLALGLFAGLGPRMLGATGITPTHKVVSPSERLHDWPQYAVGLTRIAVYGAFLLVFSIGWFQSAGLWVYEIDNKVQRHVWGFNVPTPWLLGLYSLLVCAYSPIYAAFSQRLAERRGVESPYAARFILGFLFMGASHAVMAIGFAQSPHSLVPIIWPVAALTLLPIADVVVWPSSYGMVQRLSPPRLRSAILGGWIAMLGLGQSLAHTAAATYMALGFSRFSWGIVVVMLIAAAVLWLVDGAMSRLDRRRMRTLSSTQSGTMG
jgi:POT family proton-dependent oligopeptide transporter